MTGNIIEGKIVLASASPRRRELLQRAGIDFETKVSGATEDADESAEPHELVKENALLKAGSVARENPKRLVLGADTIVYLDGKIYGKPADLDGARKMLAELKGNTHTVFTGVCAAYSPDGVKTVSLEAVGESRVSFKNLDGLGIENYLSKVDVLDKAGAYAAQEFGELIIDKIDGDFDNVMGLPVELAKKTLDTLRRNLQNG